MQPLLPGPLGAREAVDAGLNQAPTPAGNAVCDRMSAEAEFSSLGDSDQPMLRFGKFRSFSIYSSRLHEFLLLETGDTSAAQDRKRCHQLGQGRGPPSNW